MASKKVYDNRVARGLCVRCGSSKDGSETKQCLACIAKAREKRELNNPPKTEIPPQPDLQEKPISPDYSKERVFQLYGNECSVCNASELELLELVTSDSLFLEKRSKSALRKHVCDYFYSSFIIDPNYCLMCNSCFRQRAIDQAIAAILPKTQPS